MRRPCIVDESYPLPECRLETLELFFFFFFSPYLDMIEFVLILHVSSVPARRAVEYCTKTPMSKSSHMCLSGMSVLKRSQGWRGKRLNQTIKRPRIQMHLRDGSLCLFRYRVTPLLQCQTNLVMHMLVRKTPESREVKRRFLLKTGRFCGRLPSTVQVIKGRASLSSVVVPHVGVARCASVVGILK